MNRLQNAKKSLAESIEALESAVASRQNSGSQSGAVTDGAVGNTIGNSGVTGELADVASVDLSRLSEEIEAIEDDLEKAMQIIAKLTVHQPPGDSA